MPTLYTGDVSGVLPVLFRAGFGQGRQQAYNNLVTWYQLKQQDAMISNERNKMKFGLAGNALSMLGTVMTGGATSVAGGALSQPDIFKATPIFQANPVGTFEASPVVKASPAGVFQASTAWKQSKYTPSGFLRKDAPMTVFGF